jgi:hypothetical protein
MHLGPLDGVAFCLVVLLAVVVVVFAKEFAQM